MKFKQKCTTKTTYFMHILVKIETIEEEIALLV